MSVKEKLKNTKTYFYRTESGNYFEQFTLRDIAKDEIKLLLRYIESSHNAEEIKNCLYKLSNPGLLVHLNTIELQMLKASVEKITGLWQDFTVIRDRKYTID